MYCRPWSKESERILKQLHINNGKAFSFESNIAREFGKKYPNIFNNGFLDTATTRYSKRKDKTLFQTPPDVVVFPKGLNFHFIRKNLL